MSDDTLCEPLGNVQVKRRANWIKKNGTIVFTPHAQSEMASDDFDAEDVYFAIRDGNCVYSNEEKDMRGIWSWRYRIVATNAAVVVSFEKLDTLIIVTVWKIRRS